MTSGYNTRRERYKVTLRNAFDNFKEDAKEYEVDFKRQIKTGVFLKDSDLKNFSKFFEEIYMDYSRRHKTPKSTDFDQYYGKRLVEEFSRKNAESDWLFTNREGEQMKAIKKGFTAACKRAGIKDLRSYDLRHTFATRLLDRGVHQFIISALLRHSTPMS